MSLADEARRSKPCAPVHRGIWLDHVYVQLHPGHESNTFCFQSCAYRFWISPRRLLSPAFYIIHEPRLLLFRTKQTPPVPRHEQIQNAFAGRHCGFVWRVSIYGQTTPTVSHRNQLVEHHTLMLPQSIAWASWI